MWLINKYKVVSIFFFFFVLGACARFTPNMQLNTYHEPRETINKVPVIKDHNLARFNDQNIDCNTQKDRVLDINSRIPVYVITGRFNSLSSIYGQILCDNLNSDFSNNKYLCIIQSQENINEATNLLRKEDLSVDSNAPYVADFLITRADYLLEKQKSNSGPLKGFPTLDVVMFLNGSYLYLWGDSKFNSIEFSQFVTNFNAKYPESNIKVAIASNLAKELITKVILSNTWAANFEFIALNEESINSKSSKTKNYNIIAFAGPTIDTKLIDYINVYNKNFVPLGLSDNIILNTQKANNEISYTNIAQYFTPEHLIDFIKLNSKLNSTQGNINSDPSITMRGMCELENKESQHDLNLPFINDVKCSYDYDRYIFGKTKFNFNVKPIEDILSVDKVINISNAKINSVGIRNVLVASRATNPVLVFSLLSAVLTKHDLIKINFATPDMKNYNINNIITGNLYNNNFIYHYGVLNFTNYATNYSNNRLWDKESEISGIINKFLDDKNTPPFYGPSMPNSSQVNTINKQVYERNIMNEQEKVLESFKSIIDTIKEEMKNADKKDVNVVQKEEPTNTETSKNIEIKGSSNGKKNEKKEDSLDIDYVDSIDILKTLTKDNVENNISLVN